MLIMLVKVNVNLNAELKTSGSKSKQSTSELMTSNFWPLQKSSPLEYSSATI